MIMHSVGRVASNGRVRVKRYFILLAILGLAADGRAAGDRPITVSPVDKVTIRSGEAWEDVEPDVIHFSGDFYLEANDWNVSADLATLYGKLDDPETVVLTGTPAQVWIRAMYEGEYGSIEAEAARITYRRDRKVIQLEGDARLARLENILSGQEIEYHIETDQLRAGGKNGVKIRVLPVE